MWEEVLLPVRRLPDPKYNMQNCTSCETCDVCNDLRTTKKDCIGCMDCFEPNATKLPCRFCEMCSGDPRFVNCTECKSCDNCKLIMDQMKPPKLKGHSAIVASQGMIVYGGITWPDVDMTISDEVRKNLTVFEEVCKDKVEYLV